MKDYLNNAEIKELVILATTRKLVEHFVNGNVMTKQEKSNLKRGSTYIKNTLSKMIQRLGGDEAKKFVRTFEGSKVVAITDSELEVIQKRKSADLNAAYEENKEYIELCEIVMDMNCKNCNKNWKKCDLCKHFDENEVIPYNDDVDLGNCKYAYKKE